MRTNPGMLKLSLWPSTNKNKYWSPTDAMTHALLEIENVKEVGMSVCGNYIILEFDSIEDMQKRLSEIEKQIKAVLENRSLINSKRNW